MTISRLWYVTTAIHFWRFYFRFRRDEVDGMTEPSRLNWEACDRAVKLFSERETDILRQYYLTDYGRFDDMRVIEQYAIRYGMTRSELWDLVKKANYNVIVERGLMDRRELKGGEAE